MTTTLDLPRLQALAGEVVLATWESPAPLATGRHVVSLDGAPAPRPTTSLILPTAWGGARLIVALRLPSGTGGELRIADEAGETLARLALKPGRGGTSLDPTTLLSGLDGAARVRLVKLVIEFCRGAFRLQDSPEFAASCRRLIDVLAPEPPALVRRAAVNDTLLWCEGSIAPGFGPVASAVVVGPGWLRQLPFAPYVDEHAGRNGQRLHVLVDRRHAEAGATVVLFGDSSLACRRLEAGGETSIGLIEKLARGEKMAPALREYVGRALAAQGEDGRAAAVKRDLELLSPLPKLGLDDAKRALAAEVDLALGDGEGVFLAGWLRDPLAQVEAMALIGPRGPIAITDEMMFRITREDIEKRFAGARVRASDRRHGFLAYVPVPKGDIALQPRLALTLRSGGKVEINAAPPPMAPAEARNAVLASASYWSLTPDLMARGLGPPASRLHRAHLATRRAPEIVRLGAGVERPGVTMIVPLYRNLEFLRFQLGAFATDRAMAGVELIYVLDSPEQRPELEHALLGLHGLYGMAITLVINSDNYGFAAACNAGAALARGQQILFLNSDVVPDRPGWLAPMVQALRATPAMGAVGPKLLFEDESLQHAGLHFKRDLKGDWLNMHYYKGYPRDFAPAREARIVPAVTGAAIMLRRAIFERVGGFSEDYVIGDYEDSDLCLKLREAGHEIGYVPAAELFHFERRSITLSKGYTRSVASEYNRFLHQRRWGDAITALMARFEAAPEKEAVKPRRRAGKGR